MSARIEVRRHLVIEVPDEFDAVTLEMGDSSETTIDVDHVDPNNKGSEKIVRQTLLLDVPADVDAVEVIHPSGEIEEIDVRKILGEVSAPASEDDRSLRVAVDVDGGAPATLKIDADDELELECEVEVDNGRISFSFDLPLESEAELAAFLFRRHGRRIR